jgi:tetratricopeptide (TPR) repeat protein
MRRDLAIAVLLVLAVLAAYGPLRHAEFVSYDDPLYITENPHVRVGLTGSGVGWAMTATDGSNWHPLTWLAHMADCQVFGLWAGGHHLVSVGLHAINAVLLFWLLRRMTAAVPARHSLGGGVWLSAFVAGLFALHPLHVESVAWISERKDVLSTFFGLLALLAYVRYAERPGVARYVPVFVLLALGLMAKPMLVTLPFVMLLLDYWPLGRFGYSTGGAFVVGAPPCGCPAVIAGHDGRPRGAAPTARCSSGSGGRLVLEKLPLFVLMVTSSAATYYVQQTTGAMRYAGEIGFPARLSNALVSYVAYLGQTVWPQGLAFLYPLVELPPWQAVLAAIFLVAVTALVIWQVRRRPYLAVGWFWYVGMLVPVIGLVQVGGQARADRYTYLPLVGIFIAVAWGAADLLAGWRHRAKVLVPAALVLLAACGVLANLQSRTWSDSETLYYRALAVAPDNPMAHLNLASGYVIKGRYSEAVEHCREALRVNPRSEAAETCMGLSLAAQGRKAEALPHFRRAVELNPELEAARTDLGMALFEIGQFAEAEVHLREAVRLLSDAPWPHIHLAFLLVAQHKDEEAATHAREALRLGPDLPSAHNVMGAVLNDQGRAREAVAEFHEALRLDPTLDTARFNLAGALAALGQTDEAVDQLNRLLKSQPHRADLHAALAMVLTMNNRTREALAHLDAAIELQPDSPEFLSRSAWIRATDPDPSLRSAAWAIAQAERACALTRRGGPAYLEALAAAYAEAGRFAEAVATAREAVALARSGGANDLAAGIERHLKYYVDGKPYRSGS